MTDSYNPDVLSCLANLSNDEVFTPPEIVNEMLDLLPQSLFKDPNTKFLDPFTKSGVFLREITKRLIIGLEEQIPNLEERIDHILKEQVYGIAITELTSLLARRSLYCSKYPNSKYSVTKFSTIEGNIRFKHIDHYWKNKKCVYCGASESEYKRSADLETHAYEFIHTNHPERILNMKFDVIIGNPPYQLSDGGSGTGNSALPLYDKFVLNAIKLNPRFVSMIIPSRWYAGGRGLDDFRKEMLENKHLKTLVDYPKSRDCFDGVDIAGGVCYFLWDKQYNGECEITNINGGEKTTLTRQLNEFPIFIRYNKAIEIIRKVYKKNLKFYSDTKFTSNPFGCRSFVRGEDKPFSNSIALLTSAGDTYIKLADIDKNKEQISKYKVCFGKINPDRGGVNGNATNYNVINKPFICPPNKIVSETYLMIETFDSLEEAECLIKYIKTKFARFLVFMSLSSMNITNNNLMFVPRLPLDFEYSDANLYEYFGLNQNEIAFIEGMIKEMN